MPRSARIAPGGLIFHVLNRANGNALLFESAASYRDFFGIVDLCAASCQMRILAFCAMPNHWHMVVWPLADGDLSRFMHRLSTRHTHRWHSRFGTTGRGHLYQARYKNIVVRDDAHLLTVCRYVERNPVNAGLVAAAEDWPWSSAQDRAAIRRSRPLVAISGLPVDAPDDWLGWLRDPGDDAELERLRECVRGGVPYGDLAWRQSVSSTLGVPVERLRPGRPRKEQGRPRAQPPRPIRSQK